jgi:hypothetical protein
VLWNHDADRERCLEFTWDTEGVPKRWKTKEEEQYIRQKVAQVAATASHCHFNRDLQFNSQSTAMQITPRKTIGGRSWPTISLADYAKETILTLWANCTLGFLLHWWHSNKNQAGRGVIGITALETLPVLDISVLTDEAIEDGRLIFDDLKNQPLRPFNEIGIDPVRSELDEDSAERS